MDNIVPGYWWVTANGVKQLLEIVEVRDLGDRLVVYRIGDGLQYALHNFENYMPVNEIVHSNDPPAQRRMPVA